MASEPATAARVYLLWGDDTVTRAEVVQTFRERMLARPCGELNLSDFRAPDVDLGELIGACDTVPFLDERRLVIVHELFSWRPPRSRSRDEGRSESLAPGRSDSGSALQQKRSAFLEFLPRLAPSTTLLLVEGNLTPAQRSEIEASLPAGRGDVRALPAPQGAAFDRWLGRRAKQHGGQLGPGVAASLRGLSDFGLEALDQEVAKLVVYAGDRPVSLDDLRELSPAAQIVIFELLDAVAERRQQDALLVLQRLLGQGLRPEELFAQLGSLYRRLLICKLSGRERLAPAEVQRRFGVKVFDKLKRQSDRLPVEALEHALQRVLEADRLLKRGEVLPEEAVQLLVLELAA
jgi:DNA polymerase-3 subunit delta